ncbi:SRPBCC family protein [Nocardioides sp.]|uniref:SRPBCC family protein n=1 Tax=Nocardioides sp. TaxID=35761 RepID=UPI00356AFF10
MTSRIVSASTTIPAPAEVVFAILADPRQHARIDGSGTVRGQVTGPERLELDSRFGMEMKMLGLPYKTGNRVVEFEEDRLIAWRHVGQHRWRYELEPVEGGTRVTESWDYSRYHAVGAKALELLGYRQRNRQGIEATLVRLSEAAQADAAG